MKCRFCGGNELNPVIDLGSSPPSNAYLGSGDLNKMEKWFPLKVHVCTHCRLVQTEDYSNADELFDQDYAYFSSYSQTMLEHSRIYVDEMIHRFSLSSDSSVIEVAANDGYLLQYFMDRGIPCLGIEPTKSTAEAARAKKISVIEEFFGVDLGTRLASKGHAADLIISNNVLAHVPDINDFVAGYRLVLKRDGVATFEFPYLAHLFSRNQFDTIYHEHYSYLSLSAVDAIFAANGLRVFDVEQIETHGGSLRVFAQRDDCLNGEIRSDRVIDLLAKEYNTGYCSDDAYTGLQVTAEKLKDDMLSFLLEAKRKSLKVCAFGAAAKGNTFINFAGIRPDMIQMVADSNPAKQGKFLPGSRIPIVSEVELEESKPDYVVILPWNIKDEIIERLGYMRSWGCKFVVAIPEFEVL